MKSTVLKIAASAIAISVGTSAFAQMDQQELKSLTCAKFMEMDAAGMRTLGLQLKGFPGTDIDVNGQMVDTSGDTQVVGSAGNADAVAPGAGDVTTLGETEPAPAGETEITDSSGTTDLNVPTAMGDMADDEVVPFILTACEGQPDTLVITALRTN